MASEDARYRQSSQYRLWSFSPAQLAAIREKTNALARSNISERLLSAATTTSTSSSNLNPHAAGLSAPPSGANTPDPHSQSQQAGSNAALPEFLTPAEELQLLSLSCVTLMRAADHWADTWKQYDWKQPSSDWKDHPRRPMTAEQRATAVVFLRRFYVTNSIMTYPATEMLKTCMFFGCKAEGRYDCAAE
jgi:cyclin H